MVGALYLQFIDLKMNMAHVPLSKKEDRIFLIKYNLIIANQCGLTINLFGIMSHIKCHRKSYYLYCHVISINSHIFKDDINKQDL